MGFCVENPLLSRISLRENYRTTLLLEFSWMVKLWIACTHLLRINSRIIPRNLVCCQAALKALPLVWIPLVPCLSISQQPWLDHRDLPTVGSSAMGIDAEALLLTRPTRPRAESWRLCSWAMELPRSSLGSKYSLLFHLLESPGAIDIIDGWIFMDFWGVNDRS